MLQFEFVFKSKTGWFNCSQPAHSLNSC